MAMEMGSIGRPVWLVVNDALKRNPSYDLILCGHSLGAGLCTMLGLVKSPYIYVTTWLTPIFRCGQTQGLAVRHIKADCR